MSLSVKLSEVVDSSGNVHAAKSWCVSASGNVAICYGFGRQQDAEIAMGFMNTLNVDWSAEVGEVSRQCAALGFRTHESMMKAIAQHLQW